MSGLDASLLVTAFAVALASLALTRLMIAINITDVPNHRSSHTRPTPKSGGLAMAVTFAGGLLAVHMQSPHALIAPATLALYLGLIGAIVGAAVLDDLGRLSPALKLALQIICAGTFATGIAHVSVLPIPGLGMVELGIWGTLGTVLWIVALLNLINFMDGINGLVSGVSILAAVALALLALRAGQEFVGSAALLLAAATAGFFVFNFPAGRIFLGDTGSQLLGFVLATLAVFGTSGPGLPLSPYLVPILLVALLFDAVYTLVRRLARGEMVWVAHRDHLYQRLTRAGLSHAAVSPLYFALSLVAVVVAAFVALRPLTDGLFALGALAGLMALFATGAQRYARARGS